MNSKETAELVALAKAHPKQAAAVNYATGKATVPAHGLLLFERTDP